MIDVDYDELPTVADQESALAEGAPLLHPDWGTNVAADFRVGDDAETVEAAMARAARVVERRLVIPRIVPSPMETRGSWRTGTPTCASSPSGRPPRPRTTCATTWLPPSGCRPTRCA